MAKCERNKPNNKGAVTYSRHRYKKGICVSCGASQKEQLRALANRRAKRKANRAAQKKQAANPMIYA